MGAYRTRHCFSERSLINKESLTASKRSLESAHSSGPGVLQVGEPEECQFLIQAVVVVECTTEEEKVEALDKYFGITLTEGEKEGIRGWGTELSVGKVEVYWGRSGRVRAYFPSDVALL